MVSSWSRMNVTRTNSSYCLCLGLGRTVEETSGEFEGHLIYLTHSEESLIKKSCSKTWRGADSTLVQPIILATKTGPQRKNQRMFQEEDGFVSEKGCHPTTDVCGTATFPSWFRYSPSSWCVLSVEYFLQKPTEGSQSAKTFGQPCVQRDSRTIERKKKLVSVGAPWPAWTLNLTCVR